MVDGRVEAARIGVGAGMLTVYGLTLNEWLAMITIVYFVVQFFIMMPKVFETIGNLRTWLQARKKPQTDLPMDIDSQFLPEKKPNICKRAWEKVKEFFIWLRVKIKLLFSKLCSHEDNE